MRTRGKASLPRRAGGLEREAAIGRDAEQLAGLAGARNAGLVRASAALFLDEILSSTALAGASMDKTDVTALLGRGVALGGRPLTDYEAVADYASAARYVDQHAATPSRASRVNVTVEEILELHRRAMLRTGHAPGAWRDHNAHALASGLVPPPHWLVTREVAAFVDRYAGGPPADGSRIGWVAGAHARFLRIQPFDDGNGRVGRLVSNLLLRRLGLPVAAFRGRLGARYPQALARADSGDVGPLAALFAEAVHEALSGLLAAGIDGALLPLRRLAGAARWPALIKAAQRGRLRVVRDGARVLSTAAWVAEYETSRARRPTGTADVVEEPTAG